MMLTNHDSHVEDDELDDDDDDVDNTKDEEMKDATLLALQMPVIIVLGLMLTL